ncbi:MAG: hypothetical protein AB7F19_00260 [Candidatus Babeliales bacterium]
MKHLTLMIVLIGAKLCAMDPALVTVNEDFDVQEVVARLDEHMTNVESWYQTSKRCAVKTARKHAFDMSLLRSVVQVTHPVMITCFNDMEREQSLDPFFRVWHHFKKSYTQSPEDQLLCKEVAFLDMHLYSTMLSQLQRSTMRVTVAQMLELYRLIAALPIRELLALLDSIAREIIELLDQTYQGEDSFFVWLWHNWWVPPAIISHSINSLVEGIITIMTSEKAEAAGGAKENSKERAMVCA